MTLRKAMRTSGVTPPERLPLCMEYGRIGETDAAFISVFDSENHYGPRFGFAVWMREGFLAKQISPQWRTEMAASNAADAEWGPIDWHEKVG